MLVLGIETSCDETSAALVDEGYRIRANVILSQQEHAPFGGVVPELASRAHLRTLVPVVRECLSRAGVSLDEVHAIAVTHGPGLVGSLLVGLSMAKALALASGKPLVGVHHLEGHIFSNLLENDLTAPFLVLLVSGGHTELVLVPALGEYHCLGRTRDDAAGEAFDKVAKVLGLLPPGQTVAGGRAVAAWAERGNPEAIPFPRGMSADPGYDFSFSGLKTAVLNHARALPKEALESQLPDIAASFQAAVVDALAGKAVRAVEETGAEVLALAGGVAANRALRDRLASECQARGVRFHCPPPVLCTDNAAMIAAVGVFNLQRDRTAGWDLDVDPRLRLGS
ncbi:MAG: tRNA (adenosine(37)-N6)-threonylcarbamoyltransferase complex transferase subunit TsaD, partial [Candidatus Latescibacterota bacterium]